MGCWPPSPTNLPPACATVAMACSQMRPSGCTAVLPAAAPTRWSQGGGGQSRAFASLGAEHTPRQHSCMAGAGRGYRQGRRRPALPA